MSRCERCGMPWPTTAHMCLEQSNSAGPIATNYQLQEPVEDFESARIRRIVREELARLKEASDD